MLHIYSKFILPLTWSQGLLFLIMSKDPAVLFYTSDFLTGTTLFTDEECGQYIKLLCHQHQLGHLPELHMYNICKTYDSPVWKKFKKDKDGNWFNERMDFEKQKRINYSESRRKNVFKRYNKNKTPKNEATYEPTYEPTYVEHMYLHMENENENKEEVILCNTTSNTVNKYIIIKDIIQDLNYILGTKYNKSKKMHQLIKARINEGFSLEDFKKVHRHRNMLWSKDEKMREFLRPETLYSSKFESYLNMAERSFKDTENKEPIFKGNDALKMIKVWEEQQHTVEKGAE